MNTTISKSTFLANSFDLIWNKHQRSDVQNKHRVYLQAEGSTGRFAGILVVADVIAVVHGHEAISSFKKTAALYKDRYKMIVKSFNPDFVLCPCHGQKWLIDWLAGRHWLLPLMTASGLSTKKCAGDCSLEINQSLIFSTFMIKWVL